MKLTINIIIGVLILYALLTFNPLQKYIDNSLKTDTIYKVIEIPSKKNSFTQAIPKPIIIKNYISNSQQYDKLIKQLEIKYNKQADSATILRELLQAKKPKIYKESFKDSIIEADVTAYVTDKLDSLNFKYTRLPFTYKEQTIFVSPKFRILTGVNMAIKKENVILGSSLGVQNSKGNYYGISAFTDKSVMIEAKFNIFEK